MKHLNRCATLLFSCAVGVASASTLQDFQSGLDMHPDAARPVAELLLPDAVYRGITRPDLDDVGVFNAQGTPVPFAFCPPPIQAPAAVKKRQALTLFPLQNGAQPRAGGSRVDVSSPDGLKVTVQPGATAGTATSPGETSAYVVDASAIGQPLQGLYVRWHTPDGASALHLRVDASDDLDSWTTLIPSTTLLHADASGASISRDDIELPLGHHHYLRLTPTDPGTAPSIEEVQAEFQVQGVFNNPPFTITPARLPRPPEDAGFPFDAERLAPVHAARISLPTANMNLQVALQSRPDADSPWRTVWSGPVFEIGNGSEARRSPDPEFGADTDRWWRIQVLQGVETLGQSQPSLSLGYRPVLLRFLTQGEGPFTLAYGSRRVTQPSATACDALLQGLPQGELQTLVSRNFKLDEARALGGAPALQPPPPAPTPRRQVVLWAVLLLGAAAVLWMALSLLGRLRDRQA